jgi:hypothetical protein
MRAKIGAGLLGLLLMLGALTPAKAETKDSYPQPTSFEQFRIASPSEEIALARTAAPDSISKDAEILTMSSKGYETAVKGKNTFVCLVQRSWGSPFESAEFWNPKIRSPICLNHAAVISVLPEYLERTRWVLANMSKAEMMTRTKTALEMHSIRDPQPVSMSYMMSKQQYVSDAGGHWHPHVMYFLPRTDEAEWGANSPEVPVFSEDRDLPPSTLFFVIVPKWSDGSLAFPEKH